MMKNFTLATLLLLTLMLSACTNANEGTVQVQVIRGQISQIIRPANGWVNTLTTVGDEYYDINLRSHTDTVEVNASTKDNAAFKIKISLTSHVLSDDESIKHYVRKLGLDGEERTNRVNEILYGHINTETKNASANYDAYTLLANQENIQKALTESLKPILKAQLYLELESVQIIDRPDFIDDRIEQAASQVVANSKLKEAAEAALAAAKVEAEKKQVESQTFKDPAMFRIKELELMLDIERARAEGIKGHNGSLTIVNGGSTQLQLKSQ